MTESTALMKMPYLELSENPPANEVFKVFIHAEPVEPRRTQHGLFVPAFPGAEKLETTLARVRHFVGKENVGSPYLLSTHRADRFVMHPFVPPQIAQIAGTEPRPKGFAGPMIPSPARLRRTYPSQLAVFGCCHARSGRSPRSSVFLSNLLEPIDILRYE
jgi:hypothetical protein